MRRSFDFTEKKNEHFYLNGTQKRRNFLILRATKKKGRETSVWHSQILL